jgi:urea transport system substrate-binding protein
MANYRLTRRRFLAGTTAGTTAAITGFPHIWSRNSAFAQSGDIPVGVLYSLTGTTAIVERSMNQCALMAIEEINSNGGVLGRKIKPIVEDPESTPRVYSEKARKLVLADRVASIFGCYTTASRKAVKPVVEKRDNLLVWPTWYEGEECSKNIFYAGAAVPNQQLENSIPYLVNELGRKKIFIVGSDYGFPRGMAKVSKLILEGLGATWVADEYLPLGHTEWASMVSKISSSGADAVFSNVVGDSIVAFYREFRNQGLDFETMPLCASTTTEVEIQGMGARFAENSLVSLPYFQTVDTPENKDFVKKFKAYAGEDSVTQAAMEAVYIGVHLWAKGVEAAGSPDPMAVRDNLGGLEFNAPQGPVKVDPANLHTYLTPRLGRVRSDGLLDIVDEYPEPLVPLPYSSQGETADSRICTADGAEL